MSLGGTIYNAVFQRSSTAAIVIALGAFVIERVVDEGSRVVWLSNNKGKLWNDIKHKYEK